MVLYEQFKFFFNAYFLVVALSQFIPALQVGFLFTYILPLVIVLSVTMAKEAYDDLLRRKRDRSINNQRYTRLDGSGRQVTVTSAGIKPGHVLVLRCNQRVPADMVLLQTTNSTGASFIRTDQLDGETDWKLRVAIPSTQGITEHTALLARGAQVYAEAPKKDIYSFVGTYTEPCDGGPNVTPLSLENTLWAGTVVATDTCVALTIYTGSDTRQQMNTSHASVKVGKADLEINNLTKVLFILTVILSVLLVALTGFRGQWWIYLFRFLLLFSSIIPISLRVNLDMAKTFYSFLIHRDKRIPGTIVRTSTIPEELGRVQYLLSDKTGTLTRNEMVFKKLHLGTEAFTQDSLNDMRVMLETALTREGGTHMEEDFALGSPARGIVSGLQSSGKEPESEDWDVQSVRHEADVRLLQAIRALALCHNVSPVVVVGEHQRGGGGGDAFNATTDIDDAQEGIEMVEMSDSSSSTTRRTPRRPPGDDGDVESGLVGVPRGVDVPKLSLRGSSPGAMEGEEQEDAGPQHLSSREEREAGVTMEYQASSPDEVALVRFTESVGIALVHRTRTTITLANPWGDLEGYRVLQCFPFTSETKRMGIIVREERSKRIIFYMKGADSVMSSIVRYSDWLEEETGNMAREGLRTLVFGMRVLQEAEYAEFAQTYARARRAVEGRDALVRRVVDSIECDLELLGVTGVEDKLQTGVEDALETLRNAGVRVWMLTGDKVETATCIAVSCKLVARSQRLFALRARTSAHALELLEEFERESGAALIIDGHSLQLCLDHHRDVFVRLSVGAPAVVCCRCSPTQKAEVVRLIRRETGCRTCAIGDGGNDVSMIQAADVGIGLEGREGKQASLAADFSIVEFAFVTRLLLWHGRNAYKRTARLAHFIFHRGLIISFIQVVFSALFYFAAIAIYNGWLLVGYTTVYTMAPVFSLVLDTDVSEDVAFQYPELYKELQRGRELSLTMFAVWLFVSVFQGGTLMLLAILLFESALFNIVAITFTALIMVELVNVALEVHVWSRWMVLSEVATFLLYVGSMFLLRSYFDVGYLLSIDFVWKVVVLTMACCLPVFIAKYLKRKYDPPAYAKISTM